jgi:gluconate 2-dehydrogenase gamma chain
MTGFLYLSDSEQSLVEAIAEVIIPSDSNGGGAKEAGAIYFIDRQMASEYGASGYMYMNGPFVAANQTGTIVVNSPSGPITYTGGSAPQSVLNGGEYQYPMQMRFFIRYGLQAFEAYANSAYGANFENLSPANKNAALSDIWNNKPTSFNNIIPSDFAYELYFLIWSGFLTDPLYGGNRNMIGWTLTGFNGANFGNFYGEGNTPQDLMLATTPIPLHPASLAQFQKGSP